MKLHAINILSLNDQFVIVDYASLCPEKINIIQNSHGDSYHCLNITMRSYLLAESILKLEMFMLRF
jgi:hypothetical protein